MLPVIADGAAEGYGAVFVRPGVQGHGLFAQAFQAHPCGKSGVHLVHVAAKGQVVRHHPAGQLGDAHLNPFSLALQHL